MVLLAVIPVIAAFIGVKITNATNERIQTTKLAGDHGLQEARFTEEASIRARITKRSSGEEAFMLMAAWGVLVRDLGLKYAIEVKRKMAAAVFPDRLSDTTNLMRAKVLIVVHFPDLIDQWTATQKAFLRLLDEPDLESPSDAQTRIVDAIKAVGVENSRLLEFLSEALKKIPF